MVGVGNRGLSPSVGRSICAAFILSSVVALASCNSATVNSNNGSEIDVLDKVRSLDILPRYPQQTGATGANSGQRAQPAVFQGTEVTDIAEARPQPVAVGNGFELNFENTPVATVAKVVLGDILQTGYTIDPRVQGTVSLVSVRPVAKSDIIFVLESALRISGIVLVRDTAGYRLTPLGDAVGTGRVDAAASSPEPGYGVSVVPCNIVSAQTLLKLMDSFATKPGMVRADSTRNLLLIQGSGAERRAAVDTALSFDLDWMRGQSVGVFPVVNSGPEPVIAELEKIVDSGENGLSQNMIKFQPMARLNAILVVTKKPALLQTAATWIKRLDRSDSSRTSVHVYRVKYGEARQIAKVLTDMFGGGSSSGGLLDSADNQLAPGSGSSASGSRTAFPDGDGALVRHRAAWAARHREGLVRPPAALALVRRAGTSAGGTQARRTGRGRRRVRQKRRRVRRRSTGAARRADHGRHRQQHPFDLCRSGQLPHHRIDAAAGGPAAAAGRDRRHHRRGHAHRRALLRRSVFPDQPQFRTETRPGLRPQHPVVVDTGCRDAPPPRRRPERPSTPSSVAQCLDSISWSDRKPSQAPFWTPCIP